MRAGVYTGVENLKLQEWPRPELNPGEMLVKVRYAGICGTDMLIHAGKHPRVVPPRVLGTRFSAPWWRRVPPRTRKSSKATGWRSFR